MDSDGEAKAKEVARPKSYSNDKIAVTRRSGRTKRGFYHQPQTECEECGEELGPDDKVCKICLAVENLNDDESGLESLAGDGDAQDDKDMLDTEENKTNPPIKQEEDSIVAPPSRVESSYTASSNRTVLNDNRAVVAAVLPQEGQHS